MLTAFLRFFKLLDISSRGYLVSLLLLNQYFMYLKFNSYRGSLLHGDKAGDQLHWWGNFEVSLLVGRGMVVFEEGDDFNKDDPGDDSVGD